MMVWDYYDEQLQANIYISLDELDQFGAIMLKKGINPMDVEKIESVVKHLPIKKAPGTGKFRHMY